MLYFKEVRLVLVIGFIVPLISTASTAQNMVCVNSWTNPKTGLEECLDQKFKGGSVNSNEISNNKDQSNNSNDLPGYIKVAETRQRDKVYVKAKGIRIYKKSREHTVNFVMVTKLSTPDKGVWKKVNWYSADCNNDTLRMSSYANYDSYNQIIDGKTFGTTTAGKYQSTMSPPQATVNPNTVSYAAFEYVCSLDK